MPLLKVHDFHALAGDLASLAGATSLFAARAAEKLARLREELEPLAEAYDVVVANPPYMGSKNMGKWLASWVSDNYPDEKRDLFSSFIIRNLALGADGAQLGFMTPYVWMFISSYKQLRATLIGENTITSLIQLEYSGFAGATVPICTFTLEKGYVEGYKGGYVRLSDFVGPEQQAPRALEALANPECGWIYRADAANFEKIPGSPIAYWASESLLNAFLSNPSLNAISTPKQGLVTGDNDTFLRYWWEVGDSKVEYHCLSRKESINGKARWFPCNKGGGYKKWYGFNEYLIDWENDGYRLCHFVDASGKLRSRPQNIDYCFQPGCTWGTISSAYLTMRYSPAGFISEHAGSMIYESASPSLDSFILGFCNSSTAELILRILSPTLRFTEGPIGMLPIAYSDKHARKLKSIVTSNINVAKLDWDYRETSWDFKRHPLV